MHMSILDMTPCYELKYDPWMCITPIISDKYFRYACLFEANILLFYHYCKYVSCVATGHTTLRTRLGQPNGNDNKLAMAMIIN